MPNLDGVTCVLQARMGSSRLPGKVLAPLHGRPMLRFMLDRLAPLGFTNLVVATSIEAHDDIVAVTAEAAGAFVVRGSEQDVLDRMRAAVVTYPADTVVRLTGDCPLIDPDVVAAAIALHHEADADYTCNVLPRTFPKGLDVEVISSSALLAAAAEATDPAEREHVTPFLYRRPERFRLANLWCPEDLGEERWTVDTQEDLDFVREVVGRTDSRFLGWQELLGQIGRRRRPEPGAIHLRPARPPDVAMMLRWLTRDDYLHLTHDPTNPGRRTWIGEIDGRPVGSVRIEVKSGRACTSVVVAPDERGVGYGSALLNALVRMMAPDLQVQSFCADVALADVPSIRTLERAGFGRSGPPGDVLTLVRDKEIP